ncbi:transcriptional regulator, partial [Enterobacter cloacae subsp. cloacae]
MDKALFERLTQSIAQMDDIVGGKREPSRTFQ